MNNSDHKIELKYRALADTALAAIAGSAIDAVAQKGLAAAMEFLGLAAGAMILWDENGRIVAGPLVAESDDDRLILMETESSLVAMLRRDYKLRAAYMEFGGEPPKSFFSLPLEMAGRQFGALIGIKREAARLHEADEFLRALSAVLTLAAELTESDKKAAQARDRGIDELAAAVSDAINNPLTPLLHNLQQLKARKATLPPEVGQMLDVIEESARRIAEATKKVNIAKRLPLVEFMPGKKMIDFGLKKENGREKDEKDETEGDASGRS
jgi:signal transduction histidine kinase